MANTQNKGKTIRMEMQQAFDHAQALVDGTSGELGDRIKSAGTALKDPIESAKSEYNEIEEKLLDKFLAADG